MILVDSSVWIDHLRKSDAQLSALLIAGQIMTHPFIIGELALGNLRQRQAILSALKDLPSADNATEEEVLRFIEKNTLSGKGIGYIDAHLLAAASLTSVPLWTRDKRLHAVATQLNLA